MNIIAGVALLISFATFEAPPCSATGDLQIVPFQSKVFLAPRKLRVLLPPGYSLPQNRDRRYPVLYLNDGQDLFDVCTSIFGPAEWQVDETVDRLIKAGKLPPIIVVGIDNGGKRLRPREYLPYPDKTLSPPEPDPQGKLYPRFLLEEVVPFVEKRYRVLPGPRNRALGGSSYGAGIALYTIISRPGTFSGLLLESPSIYADDYHLLRLAARLRQWPSRIYLGTGTVNEPVQDVAKLRTFLEHAGVAPRRLRVVVQNGGSHSEKWWAERFPDAVQFLFPVSTDDKRTRR